MNTLQKSTFRVNKKNILLAISTTFLLLLTICIIINPQKYINSCYNGLLIWAKNVLPSLLPFFVITKLLCEMKSLDKFFYCFSGLNKKLFNAPSVSSYIFGMSIISGYPVGAKLIEDFYSNGVIDSNDANKLVTFCSTSGPLFIIGTVGSIMLGNATIGYILYASHIISAILNGLLYRNKFKSKNNCTPQQKKVDYNLIISNSMTSSITSVMVVGGFVAIFYMIIDILLDLKLLLPISTFFNCFFNAINIKNIGSIIASGLVEVTRGCKDLSLINLPPILLTTITSGLIAFGGMSIHCQSLCFLTKCNINVKFYFLQKITQTIFACVTCYLLCLIFL